MNNREPMLDMFIFETFEMIEQLQQIIIESEKSERLEANGINEIFRIMHTIKGSSGMMMFDNISHVSHTIEDLFYFIRESKPKTLDYSSLTDLVLEGSDLIKAETEKIDNDKEADGDFTLFIDKTKKFLDELKNTNGIDEIKDNDVIKPTKNEQKESAQKEIYLYLFKAVLFFEENCEMENIRCFGVIHRLEEIADILSYEPSNVTDENDASEIIRKQGFKIIFKTNYKTDEIQEFFMETIFLRKVELEQLNEEEFNNDSKSKQEKSLQIEQDNLKPAENDNHQASHKQSLISVDVKKLDKLMDLVGELVISEAMVTKNSELQGLQLENFNKAARQHRKRLTDLQDVVMSIRMVSLAPTLNKMNRLVRDMCKKLNKSADLQIIGQDTEVDKNIIEHIGDPLMHIVRNSMDHGIETEQERIAAGKPAKGLITIEAKNTGGEVWIIIKDDGKGLNKQKILNKARDHGLINSNESAMTDKDIYSMIFLPGFSTKDNVTEYSGRGVGMDVVTKEIEKIRGTVTVDSVEGHGAMMSIKIPLTLAIIDGMTIKVGNSAFTIPVTAIRQSFIIKKDDVTKDLDDNEMILIRGECYSILRLHELYNIQTDVVNIEDGIVVMVEDEGKTRCIFADALIGEQQVVIKVLPNYIKKVKGVSGCTLLGDGSISLILDTSQIVNL